MQDIWIKIWHTLHKIQDEESEKPWIGTLACHISINASKHDNVINKRYVLSDDEVPEFTKSACNPEEITVNNETVEFIYNEIQQMDERYSVVLVLHLIFRCTPQDIAKIGNINTKTVYTRLERGKKMLKEKLLMNKDVRLWTTKQ